MIVVRLQGGLGNQMFQYAVGKRLALRHQTSLKLDISAYSHPLFERLKGNPQRHYSLDCFNLKAEFAKSNQIPYLSFLPMTRPVSLVNKLNELFHPNFRPILKESPFDHQKNLKNLEQAPADIYLDGFWQSEDYFKEIENLIRQEFTLKRKLSSAAERLKKQISEVSSVAIHFRRTDYVSRSRISRFHGLLDLTYYQACLKLIREKIPQPHFFVFSDEIGWVKENFKVDSYPITFVGESDQILDFEEMFSISLCQHQIIANSSFSWWGAYLNQNPQKIVIAPKRWFRARAEDGRVVPKEWIRI